MKKTKEVCALVMVASLLMGSVATGCGKENYDFSVNYDDIARSKIEIGGAAVHDPSIYKADGKYYIFGSHLTAAVSENLNQWSMIADGYTDKNPVYGDLKNMQSGEFDFTGYSMSVIPTEDKTVHVWAPDVIYNEAQGLYYMYCCTSSTFNASTLVMGTSKDIEGPYEYKANLLYSGVTEQNIDKTRKRISP